MTGSRDTILYYWPGLPGRGEYIRLALEEAGVSYTDTALQPTENGGGEPAIFDLLKNGIPPNAPVFAPPALLIDGHLLFQTSNILLYLSKRHPGVLLPETDPAEAWAEKANQLQCLVTDFVTEVHDTHHPIATSLYYEDQVSEAKKRSAIFREQRIPKFLGFWERQIEWSGGPYMLGSDKRFSHVDLSIAHTLLGLDPELDTLDRDEKSSRKEDQSDPISNAGMASVVAAGLPKLSLSIGMLLSSVFLAGGTLLAMTGGIGGAALFVPLLLIFLAVDIHFAVPIASAMSFGYTLVILILHRKYVDAPAVALFVPYALAGSILGVYLNLVTPAYILCLVLAAQTTYTAHLLLAKTVLVWQRETHRAALVTDVRKVFDSHLEEGLWISGVDEDGGREMGVVAKKGKPSDMVGFGKEVRDEFQKGKGKSGFKVDKSKAKKSSTTKKSSNQKGTRWLQPAPAWLSVDRYFRQGSKARTKDSGGEYKTLDDDDENADLEEGRTKKGSKGTKSKNRSFKSKSDPHAKMRMQLSQGRTRGYGWERESEDDDSDDVNHLELSKQMDPAKARGFVVVDSSESSESSRSSIESSEDDSSSEEDSSEDGSEEVERANAGNGRASASSAPTPGPTPPLLSSVGTALPRPVDGVYDAFLEDESDDERGTFLGRRAGGGAVGAGRASMDSAGSLPSPPESPKDEAKKAWSAIGVGRDADRRVDSGVTVGELSDKKGTTPAANTTTGLSVTRPGPTRSDIALSLAASTPGTYPPYPYAFSTSVPVGMNMNMYPGAGRGITAAPGAAQYRGDNYDISHPAHFVPPVLFSCFICFFTAAEKVVVRKACGAEYWFLTWFAIAVLLGTGLIIGAWLREDFEEEEKQRIRLEKVAASNARMTTISTTATGVDGLDDTVVMREQIERARAVATPKAYTVTAPPEQVKTGKSTARQQAGRLVGTGVRAGASKAGAARPVVPQTYVQVNGRLVSSSALDEAKRRQELEQPWENPFMWDTLQNTIGVPALAFVAGVVVASVGVGGGWLVAPYLVGVMKKPEPARATGLASAVMLVVQGAICFQYLMVGRLYWSYAVYFGLIAVASGTGGWYLTAVAVEKLRHKSRLMFALFATMGLSIVWLIVTMQTFVQADIRPRKETNEDFQETNVRPFHPVKQAIEATRLAAKQATLSFLVLLGLYDTFIWRLDFLWAGLLWFLGLQPYFNPSIPLRGAPSDKRPAILVTGASTGVRNQQDGEALQPQLDRIVNNSANAGIGWKIFTWWIHGATLLGGSIEWVIVDVTKRETIEECRKAVEERLEKSNSTLYCLIANAGIPHAGPIELIPSSDYRQVFDVNVFGVIETCQAFLPLLRRHGVGSRILVISSLAGIGTAPLSGIYTGSKHAVEAISDALRNELSVLGVAVSLIEPGAIETPIWKKGVNLISPFTKHSLSAVYLPHIRLMAAGGKLNENLMQTGIPAFYVARTVDHAVTSRFPLVRYPVGGDSWSLRFAKYLLPDRAYDAVVTSPLRYAKSSPGWMLKDMISAASSDATAGNDIIDG
ncbi:hypothetical protein HDU93_007042 [Gonapodya sp. JEL0774]|nr:hypothetical protein HDU93_007042 [Gonapodya sp. JEL0774]